MIRDNISEITGALPENVTLVAVSKFRPLDDLKQAYDAGQRVFAESRPLEFETKAKSLPSDVQWHFIGHLQTNKLRNVLPYAALVQSVDSFHLLDRIQEFASEHSQTVSVLLEVHVAEEQTKQGFLPDELSVRLCTPSFWKAYPDVRICGLMCMASHTDDRKRIEADFTSARDLFDRIRSLDFCPSCFNILSMGMSSDWDIAVNCGSTMVRIGTAFFRTGE